MSTTQGLPKIVGDIYSVLEPLDSESRQKVIGSVMTLLGEDGGLRAGTNSPEGTDPEHGSSFGAKANRWIKQYQISADILDEIFHLENGKVEIIANDIPGSAKREKSQNCYLLSGIRSFLESDEAKFSDDDAMALCKNMGCHDKKNHYRTRGDLGNLVAGTKTSGFMLPAPGLRAAASLVKLMTSAH